MKITAVEENQEKQRGGESKRNLDNFKLTNIYTVGLPEGEERERAWENIWGYGNWKFPYPGKGINQMQEAQKIPYKKKLEEYTKIHINQN